MNKSTKIVLIISIISMIAVVSALSYAYVKTYQTQTGVNTISTLDCFGITYGNRGEYIELTDTFPMTDADGLNTEPYDFTFTNNCDSPVYVTINLEGTKVTENALALTSLRYAFYRTGRTGYTAGSVNSLTNGTKANSSSTSSKILTYVILGANEQRNYSLKLWIGESVNVSEMGKTYKGKVVLSAVPINYTKKTVPDWNTSSGTLLNAIKTGKYIYANNMTTPGRANNASNEGIISSSTDDYGTSYYFRGRIDDNYVEFANMCWRIVRVTGSDGGTGEYNNAIKLILYNYNPNNIEHPCSQYVAGSALAKEYDSSANGLKGYSTFNSSRDSNAYIGYMYGTRRSTSYEAEHANTNNSAIFTSLKKWYDLKLSDYSDYLADVIWCNDKSVTSGSGASNVNSHYGAYDRVNSKTTAVPSLICPDATTNDENYKKISKFTASSSTDGGYGNGALAGYKIGLITADEFAFAGGSTDNNTVYYLSENASGEAYWMLSPNGVFSGYSRVYAVNTSGGLSTNSQTYSAMGVRPMIALKSDVTVNTGSDGTTTNPYIIQGRIGA